MSKYPFSQLHLGRSCTVATAGPHILLLNSETGSVIAQHDNSASPILFSCVDRDYKHLITIGDDKKLKVWEIDGLKVLSERELSKKPTQIHLTEDETTIIISDKFGDVHSYPLHPLTETSEENPSGGTLVLGHVSLLTTFILSGDERFIITADRDEHIRVSWYPQGFNIEMFCLGHQKFVSALHIPPADPFTLVSGGGDSALKIWDWMTGSLKHEIQIKETLEPFLVVKGKQRLWMEDDDGGARRRGTGRKARAKAKKAKKEKQPAEDVEMDHEGSNDPGEAENPGADEEDEEEFPYRPAVEKLVLAVSKIISLNSDHLVFTAYGSTAIFWCHYASDNPSPEVRSLDLGKPVLNFVISGDLVWVLLDGEWGNSPESNPNMVRVVQWTPDSQQLIELHDENPLLTSLNTQHVMPASAEQLKALDLYGQLTYLPKHVDGTRDPMRQDIEEKAELAAEGIVEMTSRELGRLRHKKALAAKTKTKTKAGNVVADGEEEDQEPDSKKVKSDDGYNGEDTAMDL